VAREAYEVKFILAISAGITPYFRASIEYFCERARAFRALP